MSIIDTFYYVFNTDTEAVAKGLDEGDKAAEQMTEALEKTDAQAQQTTASFADLAKGVIGLVGAVAAFGAVKAMTLAVAEQLDALEGNARALRMDADELALWQSAIERSGGSAEEFQATIRGLMEKTKDPIAALEKMADRFKGLSDLQADKLGERLGLDKGTIEAMRQGRKGLEELLRKTAALGVVTKEQVEISKKFKDQLRDTNMVFDDVRRSIATAILPSFTWFLEKLQDIFMWMREKKSFVLAFFAAIATVLTVAYLPAMMRATAATWAFLLPYLPLIAAVTLLAAAFALVYDDVVNFMDGNASVIGELSKRWPIVGEIVRDLVQILGWFFDIAKAGFSMLGDLIMRPEKAMANFKARTAEAMDEMGAKWPTLAAVVRVAGAAMILVADTVGMAFKGWVLIVEGLFSAVAKGWKIVSGIASAAKSVLGGNVEVSTSASASGATATAQGAPKDMAAAARNAAPPPATLAAMNKGQEAMAKAAANPLAATTSQSIANSKTVNAPKTTTVTTGPITVNTQAKDGAETSAAIASTLGQQIKQANAELDDGIEG